MAVLDVGVTEDQDGRFFRTVPKSGYRRTYLSRLVLPRVCRTSSPRDGVEEGAARPIDGSP